MTAHFQIINTASARTLSTLTDGSWIDVARRRREREAATVRAARDLQFDGCNPGCDPMLPPSTEFRVR